MVLVAALEKLEPMHYNCSRFIRFLPRLSHSLCPVIHCPLREGGRHKSFTSHMRTHMPTHHWHTLYKDLQSSTVNAMSFTPSPWAVRWAPISTLPGNRGDWNMKMIWSSRIVERETYRSAAMGQQTGKQYAYLCCSV